MAYADKYYDPVKAHEYYEKHKKLKGKRTSTKGFSQSQKEMAAYVKNQLNEEKKQKIQGISNMAKSQRTKFTQDCSSVISKLRASLRNMPASKKSFAKKRIQEEINKIREKFAGRKNEVSASAKVEKDKVREDYSNKYAEALQDIRNNG